MLSINKLLTNNLTIIDMFTACKLSFISSISVGAFIFVEPSSAASLSIAKTEINLINFSHYPESIVEYESAISLGFSNSDVILSMTDPPYVFGPANIQFNPDFIQFTPPNIKPNEVSAFTQFNSDNTLLATGNSNWGFEPYNANNFIELNAGGKVVSNNLGDYKLIDGSAQGQSMSVSQFSLNAGETFSVDFSSFFDFTSTVELPQYQNAKSNGMNLILFYALHPEFEWHDVTLVFDLPTLDLNPDFLNFDILQGFGYFKMLGNSDADENNNIESSILDINASQILNEPDYLTLNKHQELNSPYTGGSFEYIAQTETNLTMVAVTSATASIRSVGVPEPLTIAGAGLAGLIGLCFKLKIN